jgi:hypothetical protein
MQVYFNTTRAQNQHQKKKKYYQNYRLVLDKMHNFVKKTKKA